MLIQQKLMTTWTHYQGLSQLSQKVSVQVRAPESLSFTAFIVKLPDNNRIKIRKQSQNSRSNEIKFNSIKVKPNSQGQSINFPSMS